MRIRTTLLPLAFVCTAPCHANHSGSRSVGSPSPHAAPAAVQMRGDVKPKGVRRRTRSVTDKMETDAEKLWSAFTRGLLKFEKILPIQGTMPNGAVGVAVGTKGDATFSSYLKQPKVIARLEAEGFERAGWGAPYPWYLPLEPGVVSPADKAVCRSLTNEQREKTEANRVAALKRLNEPRVHQDVSAVHLALSDDRPCSLCGYGDDAGTIIHCENCNLPFHDGCVRAPPVAGDWFCAACKINAAAV